eukprot:m.120705 g.120705  ORF g.120705 m.120705 type:complete len:749 (+) comp28826_c0_seq1:172-2418(+)
MPTLMITRVLCVVSTLHVSLATFNVNYNQHGGVNVDVATDYTATIDASADAAATSLKLRNTLIGIEMETTGHGIVGGGLSSQMVFDGSFEDPKDDPSRPPATANIPPCPGPCHWSYSPGASVVSTTGSPDNGTHSVLLQPSAWVASAGLYGRGLNLVAGSRYQGFLFVQATTTDSATSEVIVGLSAHCGGGDGGVVANTIDHGINQRLSIPLKNTPSLSGGTGGWTRVNFSLTYPSSNTSTDLGCFYLEASATTTVHVDQVFLEHIDGLWRDGSMNVRGDVADALLLSDSTTGAVGLQAMRFNGGMIGDTVYVWKNLRGPAWLRPVALGTGQWDKYQSYPFAMFEVLQLADKAGVELVMLGINVWHETPETARDLIDYLFGDDTTTYGALRAADGHPSPYNASNIIFELGNEETKIEYWEVAQPILMGMRDQCQRLKNASTNANNQDLHNLRWSIMYCPWGELGPTQGCNTTLQRQIARDTAAISSNMLWDQHAGSNKVSWPDIMLQRQAIMLEHLRQQGWTQTGPFITGETNCGPLPMETCSSLNRALVYSLFISDAARKGYIVSVMPAVWAYAACNATGMVCGGDDGGTGWPQPELVLTSSSVIKQPSWYAHSLISHSWGDVVLPVSPNRTTDPTDGMTFLDVLGLGNTTDGSVVVHATYTGVDVRSLKITTTFEASAKVCDGVVDSAVLSGGNISSYNTQAHPNNVVPVTGKAVVTDGVATLTLPPYSLTTFTLHKCPVTTVGGL